MDGRTLLERVVDGLRACGDVVLAVDAEFDTALAARLGVGAVVDGVPARGPLGALLTAAKVLEATWLFAAPGDAPFVDAAFAERLLAARRPGDEAVAPRDPERIHPLPALYARATLLREAPGVFDAGRRSLRALHERIVVGTLAVDAGDAALVNVNTPEALEAARRRLRA